ncbi:hypothetical protein ACFFRR_004583 [Megaselia abdita]
MESNLDLDKIFNDIRFELNTECQLKEDTKNESVPSEVLLKKTEEIEERLNENYKFLHSSLSTKIDEDIQKMRFELNKTYEIFKNTAETLESIQFNNLRNRIKDLHLYPEDKELETMVLDSRNKTDIPELNKIMENKFRSHPGEFGDIPELSKFFQACTQMQHGLKELEESRGKMDHLKKKVDWANVVTLQKIDNLKRTVSKECENESKESTINEITISEIQE